jgi:hypothetical protein
MFKREFSYYLIQIYIPCCMLVIVSWVSFWLDANAVPARVSLGVTTLLTMATQTTGINNSLPPVSYTKVYDQQRSWFTCRHATGPVDYSAKSIAYKRNATGAQRLLREYPPLYFLEVEGGMAGKGEKLMMHLKSGFRPLTSGLVFAWRSSLGPYWSSPWWITLHDQMPTGRNWRNRDASGKWSANESAKRLSKPPLKPRHKPNKSAIIVWTTGSQHLRTW